MWQEYQYSKKWADELSNKKKLHRAEHRKSERQCQENLPEEETKSSSMKEKLRNMNRKRLQNYLTGFQEEKSRRKEKSKNSKIKLLWGF